MDNLTSDFRIVVGGQELIVDAKERYIKMVVEWRTDGDVVGKREVWLEQNPYGLTLGLHADE